jgi:heme O synthase-like polyprenyltransferase
MKTRGRARPCRYWRENSDNQKDKEREECVMNYIQLGNMKVIESVQVKQLYSFHKSSNVRILEESTQMYSNVCLRMSIISSHLLHISLTGTP